MSAGSHQPSLPAEVWRRHLAAMRIVSDLDEREERWLLLELVLLGSEALDGAEAAREEALVR